METPKEIFHKKPVHYTVDLNSRRTHALSRITALPGNEGSSPMVLTDTYRNLICFKVNGDDLEGSFKSSGYFCTQCGAEALFKITSSQDGKHFAVCEDLFNVFVVPDCNMGAMEKMSLIIFNSKIVLAIPETATETDCDYFRNYWTDNRVTCWDYLQGVEVVRMHETLLCSQGFHKGTDLYFKRLDGQAVTCKDLYYAMRNANDVAFSNFFHLHLQARTPTVGESSCFDAKKQTFTLSISSQEGPATRGQSVKMPICIPVAIGFLESGGKDMVFLSVLHDSRMELGEVQKHKEVEWEKLPGELWEEIGKRLESRLEVDRFRSVCKSWRSVLSAWNRFPLHVPSPPGASKFESENHPCFIIQHTVYLIDGQFFVLEEIDQGGLFTVASSRYKNIEYVCKDAASHFLHSVVDNNHVYSHLSCVSTSYHLRSAAPTFDKKGIRIQGGRAFRRRDRYIRKIVLVSKNIAINPTYASDIDLVAMALLDDGRLAQLKLGNLPLRWDIITNWKVAFDDIVLFHGKLCAADSKGSAFVIPDMFSTSVKLTQIAHANNIVTSNGGTSSSMEELRNRLVDAPGGLYLLVPVESKLIPGFIRSKIKVYKYDAGNAGGMGVWVEVKCLGNQAFFVGHDHSFCITTRDDGDEYEIPLTNRIIQERFAFFKKSMAEIHRNEPKEEKEEQKECQYSTVEYGWAPLFSPQRSAPTVTKSSVLSSSTSTIFNDYESSCWRNIPSRLVYYRFF